jgi:lysophospholipase L1-like esterase
LLLEDGHHLTEAGHQLFAESIYRQVERIVNERVSGTNVAPA